MGRNSELTSIEPNEFKVNAGMVSDYKQDLKIKFPTRRRRNVTTLVSMDYEGKRLTSMES